MSAKEYALVYSVLPTTAVALTLLEIPQINDASRHALQIILDPLCAYSVPTFWCRVPRPIPSWAAIHAFNYAAFMLASLYFVVWISAGNYRKPADYAPGSASRLHQWGWALCWLFVVAGGQLLPQRTPPWTWMGFVFMALALSTGLFFIRFLMVSLKFRR